MKHIFSLLTLSLLIVACGNEPEIPTNIKELKNQKANLKQQIDSLSEKLLLVENKLSKLDTTKRLVVVTTLKPVEKNFKHYIEVQGTVKSDKSVELHPEMGGTITKIYIKEGQKVHKGQTLAQLDAGVLNNNISQLKTQLVLAKTTFERQERLWKQNIGSEIQYLQAKAQKEGLESNLNSLYAQANKMKITAPFSGVIDEIFAKAGELANPQLPFLRIVNLKEVYLETEITETYLSAVKKGTDVDITFPSINKVMTSKITQVGNFINPNNRSFKARININNSDNTIKANLLANVQINDFKADGIIIPSYVIQKDNNNKTFVYTLLQDNNTHKVVKTLVTVGKEYNNQTFISNGLKVTDLIIDKGAKLVKNNDNVSIAE